MFFIDLLILLVLFFKIFLCNLYLNKFEKIIPLFQRIVVLFQHCQGNNTSKYYLAKRLVL